MSEPKDYKLVMVRGLVGRCPNCGNGRLFARYLKQVERCAECSERYGHIRAEDGPAWLTILVVGHLLAPILLEVVPGSTWPDWVSMIVWPGLALLLAFAVLPRAKGLFIGVLWRMRTAGAGE